MFHGAHLFHVEQRGAEVQRLAVVNQKGGVGKTTTAVNLAASLAVAERATLLVDMDPQGNATTGLGIERAALRPPTIYQVLLDGEPAERAVVNTSLSSLFLLPADPELVGAEVELVGVGRREQRLREAIEGLAQPYDFVVIDCPPSLGLLTLNALVAADAAIIPLQCEYFALEGLAQLMRTLQLVRERANPGLAVGGIVLTMYDGRTSLAAQVRAEVERYFSHQLFRTVIPRNVRMSEAPSHGKPVVQYDIRSPGAMAYLELAREVITNDQAGFGERARRAPATG